MSRSLPPAVPLYGAVLGFIVALSSCGPPASSTASKNTADEITTPIVARSVAPTVEWGGCVTVVTSDDHTLTCVYTKDTPLRLWVQHPNVDEIRIWLDDQRMDVSGEALEAEVGQGFEVRIDRPGVQALHVELADTQRWSLRLKEQSQLSPALLDAQKRFREAGVAVQQKIHHRDPSARAELNRTIQQGLSDGLIDDTTRFVAGASYFFKSQGDLQTAQELLDTIEPEVEHYPWGRAAVQIYQARILRRRGRRLDAVQKVREGSRFMRRIQDASAQVDGLTEYSYLLSELGYTSAAARWSDYALKLGREHGSKSISMLLDIVASTNLALKRAGEDTDPASYYRQILALAAKKADPSAIAIAMAHARLAEIALLDNDPATALEHVAKTDHDDLYPSAAFDVATVELRAHLAHGSSPEVLEPKLEALTRAAATLADPTIKWRIAVSRGQVYEALGRLDDAVLAYEEAERLLDTILPLAALGIGGSVPGARYSESTEYLLTALLNAPEPRHRDALCVARRAQARLSRLPALIHRFSGEGREQILHDSEDYLDAKAEYEQLLQDADELPLDQLERQMGRLEQRQQQLERRAQEILSSGDMGITPTCEQLPSRQSGELMLGLVPIGSQLLVFVSDDDGVSSRRWSADERKRIADLLLPSIEDRVDRADQIRVLASGAATELAVHAFEWKGMPLGVTHPVVYGLELPPNDIEHSASTRAIVLADTQADGAVNAANGSAGKLSTLDYQVQQFDTDGSDSANIRGVLSGAAHFLYAGHAYADSPGGHGAAAWPPYPGGAASKPSYVPLHAFARLDVADILMIHPAPTLAVLLGCDTGSGGSTTANAGHSLATAFISAGTMAVIATTQAVHHKQAWALNRALYELPASFHDDPGRWMQRAMSTATRTGLDPEALAHFRVFVR